MTAIARVAPGRPARRWRVEVPGSKSLTNRALLLAAIAHGTSRLANALVADDTVVMRDALSALGVEITQVDSELLVSGLGGPPRGPAEVFCGMAGTVGRFLVPVLAAGEGHFHVDAHLQLRRRPLGPVLDALRAQGAQITGDAFPLDVHAHGLAGGALSVDTGLSSQFLSGLMLAAVLARAPTSFTFEAAVSRPYIDLTAAVMGAFGATVHLSERSVSVEPTTLRAGNYAVEPDASTASYFLASAALSGTEVTLPRLHRERTGQGDIVLADHLAAMGATLEDTAEGLALRGPEPLGATGGRLRGVHVDMAAASDVFMTLACVAPFADSPTTIEGLANVRVKESDRLAATAENLRRLGIHVQEGADTLTVHPGCPRSDVRLPTYGDHRIAMAFALIGARVPVDLEAPEVVEKTCPSFWELWRGTGAEVTLW
ncbi:MAG TPA: 3-phosphoshikimate 1-carboxyvinyltransferase [Solirubrobacteraceae bacterium]|nr:3-phosphoshikimate 1-carboxyvinyltransferase [Solirubrobacteraceae bacterium]